MKKIYEGKTKDVFQLTDDTVLLKFKDDVTGEDGVFDPGANTVGLTMDGAGKAGLKLTTFFFEKLKEKDIPTHHISTDLEEVAMTVVPAKFFGNGLEVICRYRAVGSFLKRYGQYCEAGQALPSFIEVTLKDDERGDPPISKDALVMLNILTEAQYEEMKQLTIKISEVVKIELAKKDIELYDIKLEFGLNKQGELMLIDEISGGNMRAYRNGQQIEPLKLEKVMLAED